MCPEYGATVAIFPIDEMTLELSAAHRAARRRTWQLVEAYARAQGLFRTDATPEAVYSETLELDLVDGRAEPRRARGGRRIACRWRKAKASFAAALPEI